MANVWYRLECDDGFSPWTEGYLLTWGTGHKMYGTGPAPVAVAVVKDANTGVTHTALADGGVCFNTIPPGKIAKHNKDYQ